jgi:serine/threonine protein kinase
VYEADADDDAAADAAAAGSLNAREQLAILQEYAPFGTLGTAFRGRMAASRAFATGDGLRWAHHVALGLAYLHGCSPPIIHRDLKPENVLLCLPHATAKLADFGLSTFDLSAPAWAAAAGAPARRQPSRRKPTGMVGSMRYMAPENYRGEAYTYKSDVYSFAILLYELLARARAYDDLFLNGEQIAVDAASERLLRPTLPAAWPAEAHALLRACWHADPAQRPDFAAIAAELEAWRSDSTDRVLRAVWAGARVPIAERARALVQGRAAQVAPRWPTKPVPPGGELEPGTTTVISAKRDGGATHSRRSSMAAARAEHDAAQAGF